MKKVVLVVALLIAVIAVFYGLVIVRAESRREEIAAMWRSLEPDDAFAARFPAVAMKNQTAATLEPAVAPLGIEIVPRADSSGTSGGAAAPSERKKFDEFKTANEEWAKSVLESTGGEIAPPPPVVASYLAAHRGDIDAVTELLSREEPPFWPVSYEEPPALRPIPNLLGQLNLGRVLAAAALDAALAGEQERAWRCERAQWNLAKGALSRPEMISQLIGIALSRRVAGVARKLNGPAPAWFGEMESFDFHRAMLHACRADWAASSEEVFGDSFLAEVRASIGSSGLPPLDTLRAVALRPFYQWGITEMERVMVAELLRLENAEPCAIDSRAISAKIDAELPRLARSIAGDFIPSTHVALARAASTEIAIEGSAKIAALKALREADPAGAWPAAADHLATSRCSAARWHYARAADGSVRFAFDGKVDRPEGYQGFWVPLEYTATK